MKEFNALRLRAKDRRDKALAHARREYEATLVTIAALEQDLLGKESSRHKLISASVESVIPRDRTFTTVDVMAGLEALDAGRVWRKRSIDNHISRLRERGVVRRVEPSRNTEPAVYAMADLDLPPLPFENMTLAQAIRSVLVRPMNATEIAVTLLEASYETTMDRRALRTAVGVELRRGEFRSEGGKWI